MQQLSVHRDFWFFFIPAVRWIGGFGGFLSRVLVLIVRYRGALDGMDGWMSGWMDTVLHCTIVDRWMRR